MKDKEKYDKKINDKLISASYIKENGIIIGIACDYNVCNDTNLNTINDIISHKSLKQLNTFYNFKPIIVTEDKIINGFWIDGYTGDNITKNRVYFICKPK